MNFSQNLQPCNLILIYSSRRYFRILFRKILVANQFLGYTPHNGDTKMCTFLSWIRWKRREPNCLRIILFQANSVEKQPLIFTSIADCIEQKVFTTQISIHKYYAVGIECFSPACNRSPARIHISMSLCQPHSVCLVCEHCYQFRVNHGQII